LTLNPNSEAESSQTVKVTSQLTNADDGRGISGQTITLNGTGIKQQTVSENTVGWQIYSTFTAPNRVASRWALQAHYVGNDDSKLQSSDSEVRTFASLKR
jgi:hypothetical protein